MRTDANFTRVLRQPSSPVPKISKLNETLNPSCVYLFKLKFLNSLLLIILTRSKNTWMSEYRNLKALLRASPQPRGQGSLPQKSPPLENQKVSKVSKSALIMYLSISPPPLLKYPPGSCLITSVPFLAMIGPGLGQSSLRSYSVLSALSKVTPVSN